jgi:hypothetical protein
LTPAQNQPEIAKHVAVMRISVSVLVLAAGILVLTAPNFIFGQKFDDGIQKIAAGWVGAVIGYWLS